MAVTEAPPIVRPRGQVSGLSYRGAPFAQCIVTLRLLSIALRNHPGGRQADGTSMSRQSRGGQSNDDRPGDLIAELLPDEVLHVVEQSLPG